MKLKLFIAVLALQTAWLLGTVVIQENALAHGKTIMLETQRVDPRDILRGDYLILNYKISDVPTNLFTPAIKGELPHGTKVFIAVAPGTNEFFAVVRASTNEFAPTANEILLCGKSTYHWWNSTNSIHVEYGIERFYVAEGTGNPSGKLTVKAVVPASGRARIKEVYLDGKPYADALKNSGK